MVLRKVVKQDYRSVGLQLAVSPKPCLLSLSTLSLAVLSDKFISYYTHLHMMSV